MLEQFARRGIKGTLRTGHRPATVPETGVVWKKEARFAQSRKAPVEWCIKP